MVTKTLLKQKRVLVLRLYLYQMSKNQNSIFLGNCGYESTKWLGKCPSCNQWNTFMEEVIDKTGGKNTGDGWKIITIIKRTAAVVALSDVISKKKKIYFKRC